MITDDYDVLSIEQLCSHLGISRAYAYKFIRINKIRYIQIGKKYYVNKKSLYNFINMED